MKHRVLCHATFIVAFASVAHAQGGPQADFTAMGGKAGHATAVFLSGRGLPATAVNCQIRAAYVLAMKTKTATREQTQRFFEAHDRACVGHAQAEAAPALAAGTAH